MTEPRRRWSDRRVADRIRLGVLQIISQHGVMLLTGMLAVFIVLMGIGVAVGRFTQQNHRVLDDFRRAQYCQLAQLSEHRDRTEKDAHLIVSRKLRSRFEVLCNDYLKELIESKKLKALDKEVASVMSKPARAKAIPPVTLSPSSTVPPQRPTITSTPPCQT